MFKLFATNLSPEGQACSLSDLLCCLPQVQAPASLGYRNVFRVLIMAFIDAHGFDLRAVKKSCVHIAQPDGRIIPFDTFNLFYRDERAAQLEELRAMVDRGNAPAHSRADSSSAVLAAARPSPPAAPIPTVSTEVMP